MTSKKADRFNKNKNKLSYCLLGLESISNESKVWESGAKKYSRGNWMKGLPYTSVCDSMLRHLVKFINGEDLDKESGLAHVDHIICNARMLSYFFHTRKDLDDREL